jgi:hypothetical protein
VRQRQTRTKCGGTLQPCQSVEFQIQNSCIQMQNCTYIRRLARMGPYLRHAHLSCFKRKWTLRLCRAYTVAFEPLIKTRLVISFSASSLADCDVEFSSSISSPHLARLDYPISSHSPQALLTPSLQKMFHRLNQSYLRYMLHFEHRSTCSFHVGRRLAHGRESR